MCMWCVVCGVCVCGGGGVYRDGWMYVRQTNTSFLCGSSLFSCRHMDDEQSLEIENSVLDRCIHHGGVVHIFVDRKSTYVSIVASRIAIMGRVGGRGEARGERVRHLTSGGWGVGG